YSNIHKGNRDMLRIIYNYAMMYRVDEISESLEDVKSWIAGKIICGTIDNDEIFHKFMSCIEQIKQIIMVLELRPHRVRFLPEEYNRGIIFGNEDLPEKYRI